MGSSDHTQGPRDRGDSQRKPDAVVTVEGKYDVEISALKVTKKLKHVLNEDVSANKNLPLSLWMLYLLDSACLLD